jgi:hypothetical protein
MSYHKQLCFPREAVLRLQPRAAGPLIRSLITMSPHEPYREIPYTFDRGLLVIDPRYDTLPVIGPGWESKTS